MNTPPADEGDQIAMVTYVALDRNPYADVSTSELVDTLEAQYDRGEVLTPAMVFELVDRLIVAEGLGPTSVAHELVSPP